MRLKRQESWVWKSSEATRRSPAPSRALLSVARSSGHAGDPSGVKPGDAIVLTKKVAMEATGIFIREKEKELAHLSREERREGLELADQLSVLEEAKIAVDYGVNRMHDVTEGGLLGALHEMIFDRAIGFQLDLDKVPVSPVTQKIADHFGLDVYQLISSGAMIISLEEERADGLVEALGARGIEANVIGRFTDGTDVRVYKGGKNRDRPQRSR